MKKLDVIFYVGILESVLGVLSFAASKHIMGSGLLIAGAVLLAAVSHHWSKE